MPLLVSSVPDERVLPYAELFDYCHVAVEFDAREATADMEAVLARLEAVTAAEAEQRRAVAVAVRNAFAFGEGGSLDAPSAVEHMLARMCAAAHAARRAAPAPTTRTAHE